MLDRIFMEILDMSLQASAVILAVILIRLLLKSAPKIFSYALWSVVLLRLLCPISIEAPISLVPHMESVSADYTLQDQPISIWDAGMAAYEAVGDALNGGLGVQHIHTSELGESGLPKTVTASWGEVWILFGQYVWLIGIAGLLLYSAATFIRLRKKLVGALHLQENIYLADHIESPFVLGVLKPKIYLPSALCEAERGYIIAHEQQHIRRLDHIIKLIAYVALALHWFNPLVWVSYYLFCKDMEMSCDESVIRKLGGDIRADYSASLLNLATGRRILSVTPLAFGEGDPKGRIKNLAKWKKPLPWVIAVSVLICLTAAGCLMTDQPAKSTQPPTELEMVKEAWNDAVVKRTVPVKQVILHEYSFSSHMELFEKPSIIQGLLNICAKLDVDALQVGMLTQDDRFFMRAGCIRFVTEDAIINLFIDNEKVSLTLQKGEAAYYAHGLSSQLTKGDFDAFWDYSWPLA